MESSSSSEEIEERCMWDRPGTSETVKRKRRKQKAPPATLTHDEAVPRKKTKTLQKPEADVHKTSEIYQQLVMEHDVEMTLREIAASEPKDDTTSERPSKEVPENIFENVEFSSSQSPLRASSDIYRELFLEGDIEMEKHDIQSAWIREEGTSEESSENSLKEHKSSSVQSPFDALSECFPLPEIYEELALEDDLKMEEHDLPSCSVKGKKTSEEVPKSSHERLKCSPSKSPVDTPPEGFPPSEIYEQLAREDDMRIQGYDVPPSCNKEEGTSEKKPDNFSENLKWSPPQSVLDDVLACSLSPEIYQQLGLDDIKMQEHDLPPSSDKEGTSQETLENSPENLKSWRSPSPVEGARERSFPAKVCQQLTLEDDTRMKEHNLPSSSVEDEEAPGTASGIVLESNLENLRSSPLSDLEVALQHDIIILPDIPSFRIRLKGTPESGSLPGSSSIERTPRINSPRTSSTSSSRTSSTSSPRGPSTSSSRASSIGSPRTPSTGSPRAPPTSSPRAPSTGSPRAPTTNSPHTPSTSSPRAPSTSSPHTPSTSSPHTPYTISPRAVRVGSPCNCRWRCFEQFSYLERDRILGLAQGQPNDQAKFEYLSNLMQAKSVKKLRQKTEGRRIVSCTYSVVLDNKTYIVCKKAFCSLNGVSKRYVHNMSEQWKSTHLVPRLGLVGNATDEDGDSP